MMIDHFQENVDENRECQEDFSVDNILIHQAKNKFYWLTFSRDRRQPYEVNYTSYVDEKSD